MALSVIQRPLQNLLRIVIFEEHERASIENVGELVRIHFREKSDELTSVDMDWSLCLGIESSREYRACLKSMNAEWHDGELEYLKARDVKPLLDNLVTDSWRRRTEIKRNDVSSIAKHFIESHARPKSQWIVAWQIDRLLITDDSILSVAGVEFFRLSDDRCNEWLGVYPELSVYRDQTQGKTFGQTKVLASSAERAIARARNVLTDALAVLRVMLSRNDWIRSESLGQSLGNFRMARSLEESTVGYWGMSREGFWLDVELDSAKLDGDPVYESEKGDNKTFRELALDLSFPFSQLSGNKLARLLARATVIVGTSHTRSNEVDALVDICVALETLLANRGDRLKAEAIAARYWLLFSVAGVSDANTHPLELYDFYMLRNDIVHGVERRIASRQDVTRLEYAADAAIDSIRELITADTSLQSAKQLFRLLQSEQVINRVLSHPDLSEPQESAIAVRNLLKHWQNGNR